ncbi:MAG: XrtA-associated tyrosine autokinase [Pseudomonadales bacterium]|nr:XrtA-associated tyrosine autokinase [Pseudomonadales bacterium]
MSIIEKALEKNRSETSNTGSTVSRASTVNDRPIDADPGANKPEQPIDTTGGNGRFCNINLEALASKGIITPGSARTRIKEEFRLIKRPLLDKAFGAKSARGRKHKNVIMVTSATPGEGKTFNSVSLAISLADEQNHRVLLIDADVINPSVARTFGVDEDVGLVDYLSGDFADIADLLNQTNIEDLSFLQAGKRHHLTTELLASRQMAQLIDEISNRYPDRIIILDSPPLMHTSEASVLADLAGQVILVVAENDVKQSDVRKAIARLDNRTDIGMILNKSRYSENRYGYYYGYGENRE